jgi:hypothetical protein
MPLQLVFIAHQVALFNPQPQARPGAFLACGYGLNDGESNKCRRFDFGANDK